MRKRTSTRKRFKIKVLILPLLGVLILLAAAWSGWWFINHAPYFRVREIIVRGGVKPDLLHLKGKNIFSIDMEKESGYLAESFPDYSRIRMVRVLPDRIFVDFMKRDPVALVKLYKDFALDDEGVLFYALGDVGKMALPVIIGLETKLFGPKPGRRYNIKELNAALQVVLLSRRSPVLRNYDITAIDVTRPAQTYFTLSRRTESGYPHEMIEVKIGIDNIRQRVAILAGLLRESSEDFGKIRYIDVRFKDPVIKFKDDVS
ncbi:MAG: hypothetical protein MJA29_01960 [Candidatus Omnitrophica bacterium]|nr:hypothetical protein [Candidatus Omnitrophota bacterium]